MTGLGGDPIPIATAAIAACVRFVTPSLRKTAARCAFTVFSERNRCREISRLLLPLDRSSRTSDSRRVKPASMRADSSLLGSSGEGEPSNMLRTARGESTFPAPDNATTMA